MRRRCAPRRWRRSLGGRSRAARSGGSAPAYRGTVGAARNSHGRPPGRSTRVNLPPFQRLVDDHWRDVARLARALAGPVDGDDVAQQAWTQAYAAYPSLTSARNLRSWLLTITHRCAMDLHRARGRRAEPTDDETVLAGASRVDGPEAALADEE